MKEQDQKTKTRSAIEKFIRRFYGRPDTGRLGEIFKNFSKLNNSELIKK